MPIVFEPTSAPLGAVVHGIGLDQVPGGETLELLEDALERYGVLVFPDQDVTPAQQVAFSRAFGPLEPTKHLDARLDDHPEIFVVGKVKGKIVSFAPKDDPTDLEWHADHMQQPVTARASMLLARVIPPEGAGGDTLFSCTYAAYEALSETEKALCEGLTALHSASGLKRFLRTAGEAESAEGRYETPEDLVVRWPLVRRHPRSGRKSLYFGSKVTIGIEGWSDAEGQALIDRLSGAVAQPERIYRHVWRPGDAVLWDNRRTLHAATSLDLRKYDRIMHRTTFRETVPIA